jgi:tripartite-type tricarboxylate transporter receptor subunit TctC
MSMRATIALVAVISAACPAAAQTYPSRQIELVVPFVAGGTTDTVARLIAQRLSDRWGQPTIVNNRPGGGSSIGTNLVAKAAPDGHTLMVTTIAFAINASLQKQPYDAVKDFIPITEIASIPLMLVVHNSLPVHDVKEFIEYSKSQPAGLDYATSGPGTSTHLAAEMFKTMAGANLVHVPFKGNAEVLNALLGGHVKVHFALTASTLQHVRSGALRVLAVTTEKRLPELPDVATIAELGYQRTSSTSSTAKSSPCCKRRMCRRGSPARAPTRSAAHPNNGPRGSGTKWKSGPRWPKAPDCQPRTECVAHWGGTAHAPDFRRSARAALGANARRRAERSEGFSQPRDPHCRALPGRRTGRRRRAIAGAADERGLGSAGDRGQPSRRQHRDRRAASGESRA